MDSLVKSVLGERDDFEEWLNRQEELLRELYERNEVPMLGERLKESWLTTLQILRKYKKIKGEKRD